MAHTDTRAPGWPELVAAIAPQENEANMAQLRYNYPNERSAGAQFAAASGVASRPKEARMRAKSIPPLSPEAIERFWSRVQVHHPASCWEWSGHISVRGYGRCFFPDVRAKDGYGSFPAHRVAYEILMGPLGPDIEIHHLCRNKRCCNPDHLQALDLHEHRVISGQDRPVPVVTHCKRGHEYTPENTKRNKNGFRMCRICANQSWREAYKAGRIKSRRRTDVDAR